MRNRVGSKKEFCGLRWWRRHSTYLRTSLWWEMIVWSQCRHKPEWAPPPEGQGHDFVLIFLTIFLAVTLQQVHLFRPLYPAVSPRNPSFTPTYKAFTTLWGPFTPPPLRVSPSPGRGVRGCLSSVLALFGRMDDTSAWGRPCSEWLEDTTDWCGMKLHQLVEMAQPRTWQQAVLCVWHQRAMVHGIIDGCVAYCIETIVKISVNSIIAVSTDATICLT